MNLRRFNDAGIARVRQVLKEIERDGNLAAATELLTRDDLTEPIPALDAVDLDPDREFPTTYAFCEYFHSLMKDHRPLDYRADVGFWTWLAMVYIRQLVKVDADGSVDCGMEGRIVYAGGDYKREYRHLLAAPFYAFVNYAEMPSVCASIVCHAMNSPGDFTDQIITRSAILQNPCVMNVLAKLYVDNRLQEVKKGAASSVRHFISVLDQLAMTRDFFSLDDTDELLRILPADFERFKA